VKKVLSLVSAFILNLFMLPLLLPAYAQSPCPEGFEILCFLDPAEPDAYSNFFGGIMLILVTISVITSLIYLIWGGIRWIKASGDKGELEKARSTIIAAIIGLLISFLAFTIINIILFIITGEAQINIHIPKLV